MAKFKGENSFNMRKKISTDIRSILNPANGGLYMATKKKKKKESLFGTLKRP